MMADSLQCNAYNLSSWGFRSGPLLEFFSTVPLARCRRVVVAFNNIDFGINQGVKFDFGLTKSYVGGNSFDKLFGFLKTFNFMRFDQDFQERKAGMLANNAYFSLDFDKYGSVLLNPEHFKIDTFRYYSYTDTAGFNIFIDNMRALKTLLDSHNIRLSLVYLPYRRDLLTPERESHNNYVADRIREALPDNFIDLHSLSVDKGLYADAAHFFKGGAGVITQNIIDSLKRQKP